MLTGALPGHEDDQDGKWVTVLGFSDLCCGAGAFSVSYFGVCCEIESIQAPEVIK